MPRTSALLCLLRLGRGAALTTFGNLALYKGHNEINRSGGDDSSKAHADRSKDFHDVQKSAAFVCCRM